MKKSVLRALSVLSVAVVGLTCVACGKAVSIFSRPVVKKVDGQKKEWNDVSSFVTYYGSLTGDAEKGEPVLGGTDVKVIERLKEFDVAIIHSASLYSEPTAKDLVKELQDSGTYVLAYVSVGEDGTVPNKGDGLGENGYASYYFYENGQPRKNPSWNSHFVDPGNPVWQEIVLGRAEKAYSYGVDGLFLDTVDVVDVERDTMGGMVELIKKFDEKFPDAKLVPNRGFTVYPYISQYIDGVMFESFYTNYLKEEGADEGFFVERDENGLKYNQTIACNVINRARRYDYMPVFCLEYINDWEYSYVPQYYYDIAWQYDFIPYVTYTRNLDVCPNPGVTPESKRGELALEYLVESSGEIESNGDTSPNNLAYAGNELCTVTVDSTFVGYGYKAINDGVYSTLETHDQNLWATIAWASKNDIGMDHFVQFTFDTEQEISKVNVYWAVDNGTIYSAREARIEVSDDGSTWRQVGETYSWKKGDEYLLQVQSTTFEFETVKTKYIRVFQPKNMGDATSSRTDGDDTQFSGIMWVGEVEIYK